MDSIERGTLQDPDKVCSVLGNAIRPHLQYPYDIMIIVRNTSSQLSQIHI